MIVIMGTLTGAGHPHAQVRLAQTRTHKAECSTAICTKQTCPIQFVSSQTACDRRLAACDWIVDVEQDHNVFRYLWY